MKINNEKNLDLINSLDIVRECVGIVIGDRDETEQNTLKLYIPRLMMGISLKESDGKAKETDVSIPSTKFKNSKNKSIGKSTIKLKNYMEVPPFVIPGVSLPRYQVGERIIVNFADGDIKNPVYMPYQVKDDVKRKTDIMRYYTPSKEKEEDPITDENTYFLEINSRDKFVRLRTSNADGEKCPFIYNINTLDGVVTFRDDSEKRMFEWNYDEDKLYFGTDGGIEFEMKEAAVRLKCETLDIESTESIKMKTSKFKLEAEQADFIIDNMYVENTSYEQKSTVGKYKLNSFDVDSNFTQIKAKSLYFDAPATINTGMSIFKAFYLQEMKAPGPMDSVYSGGALDGESPTSASTSAPSGEKPNTMSPGSKRDGSESSTDMKGNSSGKPLAYAEPVKKALESIAKQADKALGFAKYHLHLGDYQPLAPNPVVPATEKPLALLEMKSFLDYQAQSMQIPANKFKA